jgi:hypothetical protein
MGDVVAKATTVTERSPPSSEHVEDLMATLVILDRPDARNIPYFAMGCPETVENRVAELGIEAGLVPIVGRRCAEWIRARRGEGGIRAIATRNYIEPKTAVYVNWALFREDALAGEFLDVFPRYEFEARLERIRRVRQDLEEDLEQRLRRGGFDLGRFGEDQRGVIARRYVEIHDKIADLRRQERWLERANRLAEEWRVSL